MRLVVEGRNPTSAVSYQKYSMDFDFPGIIDQNPTLPSVDDSNKILRLVVTDFDQQIKKEMSPTQNFLANSDVRYPNKDSDTAGKYIYQYSATATTSTTIIKSSGHSISFGLGTEFETKVLGLTNHKIKIDFGYEYNWEDGSHNYTSESTTHLYRFEFPVPAHCDATIAVMQDEIPTRIDWRATFFIEGFVHVNVLVCQYLHLYFLLNICLLSLDVS